MSIGANTLRLLMDAGLEGAALLAVVASIDADQAAKPRSSGAERQARFRAREKAKTVTSDVTSDVTESVTRDGPLAHVEDNSQTRMIEPKSKTERKSDASAFRARLAPLVSAVELDEFIKVRKRKRGSITEFAAGLFIADAERCGMTPQQAATECVRSSWITVKPEYFPGRPRAGPPGPKPNPGLSTVDALLEQVDAITPSETQGNPPRLSLVALAGGR